MAYPQTVAEEPVAKVQHTEAEEEQLQLLYASLKPEAVAMYLNYFLSRTPAHLQTDMKDLIEADMIVPPTPPPPEADAAFAPMPAPDPAPEPTRY
jgi:hypothetical protein